MNFSHRDASPARTALLDKLDDGLIDAKKLAQELLNYMSEQDVKDFAESEGYAEPEDEDEDA